MKKKWYVLQSKSNKEQALYQQVLAHDIECFFPTIRVTPVNPRSRKIRPYFPNYMFVHVNLDEIGLSTLQWMPYAQGLLSFDKQPASIPSNIIHTLQKRIEEAQIQNEDIRKHQIKAGEKIKVVEGPFQGYEGIFDIQLNGTLRAQILLNMISARQVSIEIDIKDIRRKDQ